MSETELREGLLGTILAGVEHNGIPHPRHSDACHLADAKIVRAAFASFNALASTYGHRPIPAEPEQADEVAGLSVSDVFRMSGYRCPLCGEPHIPPLAHSSADLEAWRSFARLAPARDDTP